MSGELVPFGKHKGQPVDVLLADPGYRDWLLAQPWVRDRYPTFHQTIINYGGEPADTPEHNAMQAAFLDDDHCLALARMLFRPETFDGKDAATQITDHGARVDRFRDHLTPRRVEPHVYVRDFEVDGWDVVFAVRPAGVWLELTSIPACPCVCDHERDCPATATCRGGEDEWGCRHRHGRRFVPTLEWWTAASERERYDARDHGAAYAHCDARCPWHDGTDASWLLDDDARLYVPGERAVRVECKPDLGDDFPAVLRQVKHRPAAHHGAGHCVVVRRHAFESVTWDQVATMFAASEVVLVSEQSLLEHLNGEDAPAS